MYEDRIYRPGDRVMWVAKRSSRFLPIVAHTSWPTYPRDINDLCLVEGMFMYSTEVSTSRLTEDGARVETIHQREHVFCMFYDRFTVPQNQATDPWHDEFSVHTCTFNMDGLQDLSRQLRGCSTLDEAQKDYIIPLLAPVVVNSQGYINMMMDLNRLLDGRAGVREPESPVTLIQRDLLIQEAADYGLQYVSVNPDACRHGTWSVNDIAHAISPSPVVSTLRDPDAGTPARLDPGRTSMNAFSNVMASAINGISAISAPPAPEDVYSSDPEPIDEDDF